MNRRVGVSEYHAHTDINSTLPRHENPGPRVFARPSFNSSATFSPSPGVSTLPDAAIRERLSSWILIFLKRDYLSVPASPFSTLPYCPSSLGLPHLLQTDDLLELKRCHSYLGQHFLAWEQPCLHALIEFISPFQNSCDRTAWLRGLQVDDGLIWTLCPCLSIKEVPGEETCRLFFNKYIPHQENWRPVEVEKVVRLCSLRSARVCECNSKIYSIALRRSDSNSDDESTSEHESEDIELLSTNIISRKTITTWKAGPGRKKSLEIGSSADLCGKR